MSGTATWNILPVYSCNAFYGARQHQLQQYLQQNHSNVSSSPYIIDPRFVNAGYDVTDNKTNDLYFKSPFITMNDVFHREDERLKTFENWPLSWLDKKQLAQTGMFYTGDDDKVKCYFCEVEIGRWEREDQPVPEHLHWSPNCPLLRRRTTNNVPIDNEELNQILPPISYDICGANDAIEVRNNSEASNATTPASSSSATTATTTAAATQQQQQRCATASSSNNHLVNATTYYPEYPEYAIEAARVRSFGEWQRHMKQTPTQMAEAGFFHSGIGDRVKCFSCGGGLKDWDESDEPWEQHALWLPKCRFLKLMKGESFIDAVKAKYKQANNTANQADLLEKEKPSGSAIPPPPPQQHQQQQTVMTASTATETVSTQASINEDELLRPTSTVETSTNDIQTMLNETNNSASTTTTTTTTATATPLLCDKLNLCNESSSGSNSNNNLTTNIPEEKLCKICYANEYNTAFLPCGHVVACAKCASSVTKCPMCRKPFTDVMRVYFS